jgi:hypothetical protein
MIHNLQGRIPYFRKTSLQDFWKHGFFHIFWLSHSVCCNFWACTCFAWLFLWWAVDRWMWGALSTSVRCPFWNWLIGLDVCTSSLLPRQTALLPQDSKPPMLPKKCCLLPSFPFVRWSESGWWYSCDCDNERLLIPMLLLQANPSLSQSNANWHAENEPLTEQDQIHACHCMSLPTASQNTQYYLQAGYGLACAMASARRNGSFCGGVCRDIVFCGSILPRRVFCGSIMRRRCLLQFNPLEVLSFAVWSCGGGMSLAVGSFGDVVFCGSILWRHCLLLFTMLDAVREAEIVWNQTQVESVWF